MLSENANPKMLLCDSIYMTFLRQQNHGDENKLVVAIVRGGGERKRYVWLQRDSTREPCGDGTVLYPDNGSCYMNLHV